MSEKPPDALELLVALYRKMFPTIPPDVLEKLFCLTVTVLAEDMQPSNQEAIQSNVLQAQCWERERWLRETLAFSMN